jgi:hypothetical protein
MGKKKPPNSPDFQDFYFILIFSKWSEFYCKFQIGSQEYRRILYLFLFSYLVRSQIWLNFILWILFCALWLHHKVLKGRIPGLESGLCGQERASIGGARNLKKIQIPRTRGF